MRKLVLTLLVALAVPAAALALPKDRGDGSLAVRNGDGVISILGAKGSVLGRVDEGTLLVWDFNPFDAVQPEVFGAERKVSKTEALTIYSGKGIRFRLVGARSYTIRIDGSGIDLSAVGQGKVRLNGSALRGNGEYAIDGTAFQPVPFLVTTDFFGQVPTGSGPSTG